jgi:hypothetical protein
MAADLYFDGFKIGVIVKSPKNVIPDLIWYPEVVEFTGFRLPPE